MENLFFCLNEYLLFNWRVYKRIHSLVKVHLTTSE